MNVNVDSLCERLDRLKTDRSDFESLWQRVADLVMPTKGNFTVKRMPGERNTNKIFDSTPTTSVNLLAAGLHGMVTNPSVQWFALTLDKDPDSQLGNKWLKDVRDLMLKEINRPQAGFATNIHEVYQDLALFGTGCLFVKYNSKEKRLQFQSIPLNQVFIEEDYVGNVGSVFRCFELNYAQLEEMFGQEALPYAVLNNKEPGKKFKVVHYVYKDDSVKEKQFQSVYFLYEEKHVLSESSFWEMPYMVVRWSKSSDEVYGRSPVIDELPDIQMLQEMMRETLIATQLANRPPLLVANDDTYNPMDIYPNSIIRYRNGLPPQPLNLATQPGVLMQMLQDLRDRIRTALYNDQVIFNQRSGVTATEIQEQVNAKMRLLMPIFGRLGTDLLGPMIERVYGLLKREGYIPEPTEDVSGEVRIEYTSLMAIAQKSSELIKYNESIAIATPYINMNPNIATFFDGEAILRNIYDSYNLGDSIKDHDVIQQEKEAQEQQVQEQQSLANQQTMAQINNTNTQTQNLQKQLMMS